MKLLYALLSLTLMSCEKKEETLVSEPAKTELSKNHTDVLTKQNVKIYTYDVLPPFAYKDDQGKLTGIYIEIVTLAVSRMPGYSVTFEVVPWNRAKNAVKDGRAFAILPPYFHAHDWLTDKEPKRAYIWPYSLPLYTQSDIVIANHKVLIKSRKNFPEDYAGLTFVMFRGDGRAGPAFFKMVEEKKISLIEVDDVKKCIKMLQSGRADCTVTSRIPFAWHLKRLKESEEFHKADIGITFSEAAVISSNQGYLGYTDINSEKNFPYKKDFTIKFDIEIYKMKKNGEIQELIKFYTEAQR